MTNAYLNAKQKRNDEKVAEAAATHPLDRKRNQMESGSGGTVENYLKNPLYGSHGGAVAITFWNATDSIGFRSVRQYHPLTKLNEECLEFQFR